MTDLESIRKRLEALTASHGLARARAVMKRHTPDDIAYLLGEVERLQAESLQRLDDLGGHENEIARLTAALATAKDEERTAVVAHADAEAARMTGNGDDVGARFVRAFGDSVEAGRHRG